MSWITLVQSIFGLDYYEVKMAVPAPKTPTTTATQLVTGVDQWCLSWMMRVRSMGTATYIGVGDKYVQPFRLTAVGDTFGFYGNQREVTNLSNVYVISDTADSAIEVIALYKDGEEARNAAIS